MVSSRAVRPPFGMTVCGIEELAGHCKGGASHVVSILDPEWPVPDAFGAYGRHDRLELRFHDIIEPAAGMLAPDPEHVSRLLAFGQRVGGGAHLLVHCHAGVSRSTAAIALILAQARPELPAPAVLDEVVRIRPQAWPNLRVLEIGDALLGRCGALVKAVAGVYRQRLAREPQLGAGLRQGGRQREVLLAEDLNSVGVP